MNHRNIPRREPGGYVNPSIAVIDYGAGNMLSISRALSHVGGDVFIAAAPQDIARADAVVLPGVGAAGAAMASLQQQDLIEPLRERFACNAPILGVCLGMQLFFQDLAEDDATGLGFLAGTVPLLQPIHGLKIPHMGWNTIAWEHDPVTVATIRDIPKNAEMYFVHSYYCQPSDPDALWIAWTEYGVRFPAFIQQGNLWGVQFHPEKSSTDGLQLLRNFVEFTIAWSRQSGGAL